MEFTNSQVLLGAVFIEKILTKTIEDILTYFDTNLKKENYINYHARLDEYSAKTFNTLNAFCEKLPEYNDEECFAKFNEISFGIKN